MLLPGSVQWAGRWFNKATRGCLHHPRAVFRFPTCNSSSRTCIVAFMCNDCTFTYPASAVQCANVMPEASVMQQRLRCQACPILDVLGVSPESKSTAPTILRPSPLPHTTN